MRAAAERLWASRKEVWGPGEHGCRLGWLRGVARPHAPAGHQKSKNGKRPRTTPNLSDYAAGLNTNLDLFLTPHPAPDAPPGCTYWAPSARARAPACCRPQWVCLSKTSGNACQMPVVTFCVVMTMQSFSSGLIVHPQWTALAKVAWQTLICLSRRHQHVIFVSVRTGMAWGERTDDKDEPEHSTACP